jgi:hypothetical protein
VKRASDYTREATERCERVLVTVLGNVGPWREHIHLAGGLAPRYLVGELPEGVRPHVGTTDVDLVIGLSLTDESVEAYRTLERNLKDAGFAQSEPSFRWTRDVDGITVLVEFLCETDRVAEGRIFKPKQGLGANLSAFKEHMQRRCPISTCPSLPPSPPASSSRTRSRSSAVGSWSSPISVAGRLEAALALVGGLAYTEWGSSRSRSVPRWPSSHGRSRSSSRAGRPRSHQSLPDSERGAFRRPSVFAFCPCYFKNLK